MKHAMHKVKGGLIRISLNHDAKKIKKIIITGDFFFYPEEELENLEKILIGTKLEEKNILNVIENFYEEKNIESPGLTPEDLTTAILKAL